MGYMRAIVRSTPWLLRLDPWVKPDMPMRLDKRHKARVPKPYPPDFKPINSWPRPYRFAGFLGPMQPDLFEET